MAPKLTAHGGASHADEPVSFGAALAAARGGAPAEAVPFVGICPVCQEGVTAVDSIHAPVEGEPSHGWQTFKPGQSAVRYTPCGHATGPWDEMAALLAVADADRLPPVEDGADQLREHPGDGIELTGTDGIEVIAADGSAGGTWTLLSSDDLEPTTTVTVGTGGAGNTAPDDSDTTTVTVTVAGQEGDEPSAGSSTSTSPKKPRKTSGERKPRSQSPARTTASRSRKPAGNSTADSADDAATNSPSTDPA